MAEIPCKRVDLNSPLRCQAVYHGGQCGNERVDGSLYCPVHGGTRERMRAQKEALVTYKLQQYQELRMKELITDEAIKSLREEVGILRVTLELLLSKIESGKFIIYAQKVQLLLGQIRKTVECTHMMETKTENLLDRKVVVSIAGNAIRIVATYVAETACQREIEAKIYDSIDSAVALGQETAIYDHEKTKIHSLSKYRLKQHGPRVAEFACDDDLKSVRREICIARIQLEDIWNQCTDINKLLLKIDLIQQNVGTIQKLVETAQRMEERTNTLIDKKIVVVIADSMVNIISAYVKDSDALNEIAEKICISIENTITPESAVA